MKKRNVVVGALIGSAVVVSTLVATISHAEVDNKVTIIKNTQDILATQVVASKIDTYEGVTGYDWFDENKVVITKENKELEPIKTEIGDFEVKNLYLQDLNSKEERSIGDQSKFQDGAIFSPNNKHMFYRNQYEKNSIGYIVNLKNNIEVKISDSSIDEYDLSEAQWINDEELIMPCSSIKGFAIVNISGTITKIKDVESGVMGKEDPLNGLSITNPMKVGDKIYYITIHRGADDDDKLNVYDINTKEKKELIKDEVQTISLSPNKEQLLMLTSNLEKDVNELVLIDLEGTQREVLAEGYIYGATWSHDGTKVSYISNGEGNEGVNVVDVKTKKKSLISAGEYYMPVAWSPSDKKIMLHSKKSKNNGRLFDEIDVMNVITLK
ncbi:hypothetical protein SH2C18_39080 [Clostridium sediminicola]|uniref:TolB family protein n=1 Tax=Clostridium sediminicola TaxID=3114879 RepID=UPI0031F249FB